MPHHPSWRSATLVSSLVLLTLSAPSDTQRLVEPGLLFYLSAESGLTANFSAARTPQPTFAHDVRQVDDGAKGRGLQCGHMQLLAYRAPGNIYASRGTVSFFWRSREPVGPTPFPIFRVGYADHSSWDMVWLRIDYNGGPGFEAFVTDASLARTRVSYAMPAFPAPDRWVHLALAWDETRGIRFFVDGREVARRDGTARFDAALDQFGPHSRIISPYQVQSAYNFVRGGDIDELRIYDRMLSADNVASLARGEPAGVVPPLDATLDDPARRDAWLFRYGWNRDDDDPPPLGSAEVRIRKVEVHDAYDLKRWWWKGTDGIRETTWPGVYNRSRLPGRLDYFVLPDWDCYSLSGKAVTFTLPDEPWNHVEVSGAVAGRAGDGSGTLFTRPAGQERTFHRIGRTIRGGTLTFESAEQESPIGELGAYYVGPGHEPEGIGRLSYRLAAASASNYPPLRSLEGFIAGRFEPAERATLVALPDGAPRTTAAAERAMLPIVHVLVPPDFRDVNIGGARADFTYGWNNIDGGLDGITLELPALRVAPSRGGYIPLNVQIKDPIWPLRNLLDVSFSVKPGEAHGIFFDTRDRILPNDRGLYLTIASASSEFGPHLLEGATVALVFKPRADAAREHVVDRFTQLRDNFAHISEERPNNRRLDLYNRFAGDLTDLLRVDPQHRLGRLYWHEYNRDQPRPAVALEQPPAGAPLWAARQLEALRAAGRVIDWYIDRRQIANGEFGGGLSDDGDLTNAWPGAALMGFKPAKLRDSVLREMEAMYAQGMFVNGLPAIQSDELHSYEEGINVLGQALLVDDGNPKHLERAMETARALEELTGVNAAGHRHIRSSYFSGTTVAEEGVWGWSKPSSFLILQPAIALVEYNGSPRVRRWLVELADGLLAHYKPDASGAEALRATVRFATDEDAPAPSERAWPLLWAAFRWTSDRKYLQPLADAGVRGLTSIAANALDVAGLRPEWGSRILPALSARPGDPLRHFAWQVTGDTKYLEELYADQIAAAAVREYINTEGSLWTDRVIINHAELQRARLGGVALVRNAIYPGHVVSWEFDREGDEERLALLVPEATPRRVRIVAHNLARAAVTARMTGWGIDPGTWKVTDSAGTRMVEFERGSDVGLTFPARTTTTIELQLESPAPPYWSRPDLAISRDDVRLEGDSMRVTVHNLGAVEAPLSRVVVRDRRGREIGSAPVAAIGTPDDLRPRTATVVVPLEAGAGWRGGSVSIEPPAGVREISRRNNVAATN
jgi:hypothetical protein